MTIGAWLRAHASAPPPLSDRVVELVCDRLDEPGERADEIFVECAERLLGEVVSRPDAGRESALDLLAVDALITYAFEAASTTPDLLPERANRAMRRLARLATP